MTSFVLVITVVLVLLNVVPLFAIHRAASSWIRSQSRRRFVFITVAVAVAILNVPILYLWARSFDHILFGNLSSPTLRAIFYPSLAWYAAAGLCTVVVGPAYVIWAIGRGAKRVAARTNPAAHAFSRRSLFVGGAGLFVPAAYGASAYTFADSFDDVEISPEMVIPMPHLPRSLEGLTIAQLTDLHVGPFIRRKDLQRWVGLVNGLKPDLIVLTGDIIDRSLDDLPDAVEGLKGLRAPLGVVAVLGNHDLTSDRRSARGELLGGENIACGLSAAGVRTLRNEVMYLGSGSDRLAVIGMDWVPRLGSRGFYSYRPEQTRIELARLAEKIPPETASVLLVHHPDTFTEVPSFRIGLTLSGHTHGGGQVVFYYTNGVPVGLFSSRFVYPGGFFHENGCSLYVNRGLGYLGVPVRVNCPPEISRFRLARA